MSSDEKKRLSLHPKLSRNYSVTLVCSMSVCCEGQAQIQPKLNPLWGLKQCCGVLTVVLMKQLWSGGIHVPYITSLAWTATLCCGWERQVPDSPLLLLSSCSDCAFHSSVIKADGCLQNPRQMDRWALLPSKTRARACWPCLFSWLESVKAKTLP